MGARANWHTPDSLDTSANKIHKQIHAIITSANFGHLQEVALLSRQARDGSIASGITCAINSASFAHGMNNLVFKIAFSDHVYWIARVHHAPVDPSRVRENAMDMLSEIATMKTLNSRTTIPVPQVFAFDVSPTNGFGFPYVLMEYLEGQVLDSIIARHVPAEHLPHVASQLADVLFQLENLAFDQLGRIWCGENCDEPPRIISREREDEPSVRQRNQTSLEWFYKFRQQRNRRALEGHADDPEWRTACWVLKTALSYIIIEDRLHVIDWSQAATAPLERLAVSPELITFPALPSSENQIIIDFRDAVRDCLQELVNKAKRTSPTADHKTKLYMILGSKQAEITHRCTYSRPYRALCDGRLVSTLIYGDGVSWKQLVAAYGGVEFY
ncbi:hypothetical protein C2857_001157 [Epichloe festucae Fl1]|uniref:Aminoglycoside phosphotransferase domain-containing protein n=1 Tax=Epichloe festucae (strain Fl1) TaxID=877507 RepID=A0A7S9KU72_EPIFF|nr:hypothetical protein C2857_001157 [Epichloe festucae Fl1]